MKLRKIRKPFLSKMYRLMIYRKILILNNCAIIY
jgi:hypothetical protein